MTIEINGGKTVIEDTLGKIHRNPKGEVVCCGKKMHVEAHYDFTDRFIYVFACDCGNKIKETTLRSEEEMIWHDMT